MLGVPDTTAYDLRFRVLRIPVRVHPLFWLVMALLSHGGNNLKVTLIFVACAFVSVLVHEFGHGLMARALGYWPSEVVLYGMGGYCVCEFERQTFRHRLAVLLSGPGAGFVLLGVVVLVGFGAFGIAPRDSLALIDPLDLTHGNPIQVFLRLRGEAAVRCYYDLLAINFWWGIFNLLPIWPLDGGRITEVLLSMHDRRHGTRRAHIVSLIAAGLLAMWRFRHEDIIMGIWFAYFALINFQVLQALHQHAKFGGLVEDDADWWKR
jgi:Zn-dependent protease